MQFELKDIKPKVVFPGLSFRLVHTDKMTMSYVSIEEGAEIPEHFHPHEQVVNMLEGKLELTVAGTTHTLVPGSILVIPSNAPHSGRAFQKCEVLDVFSPPRKDYQ